MEISSGCLEKARFQRSLDRAHPQVKFQQWST
uniref:Uncharacterized protein n=1 Tax=Nelumbo nucifera TaxID=4432 RepID=A0A822ZV98_NELNU|nr:TPA_asm: hypothetical protein HUJ06_016733 [Nelumbo nucifera]